MVLLNGRAVSEFIDAIPLPAAVIGEDERILATNQAFDLLLGSGLPLCANPV